MSAHDHLRRVAADPPSGAICTRLRSKVYLLLGSRESPALDQVGGLCACSIEP